MIQYLYLGRVGYEDSLRLQAEMAAFVGEGRLNNVLLLIEHPPVLTLGRNANRANVLAGNDLLATLGVTLHEINRGGDVTFHGPGQLVGYPIFDLRTLGNPNGGRMGPVDFVRGMEEALIGVCGWYGVQAKRLPGLTGVWVGSTANREQGSGIGKRGLGANGKPAAAERKIGAIGIHVAKGITSHGFAFNVTTDLRNFALIVPCGIADHGVTSLEQELALAGEGAQPVPTLEEVAHQAARQFGMVFAEQVLAVESLDSLRAWAAGAGSRFPAEDTPLRAPAEVERLRGIPKRPVQA